MEYRPLNIIVISAEGIKDMNMFSKQDVYAIVSLKGYKESKQKTPVDQDCGTKPKWNHPMEFIVDEPYLTKPGLKLLFKIKAESALRKDKKIGTVTVSIHDLFNTDSHTEKRIAEHEVITESGKSKGTLKFSYCFGEKLEPKEEKNKQASEPLIIPSHSEPIAAYTPPSAAPYSGMEYAPPPQYAPPPMQYAPPPQAGYAPQPIGYGYQQPPQPGYGYPQAPGYGYPQGPPAGYVVEQQPKKSMGGMGMAAGVGVGLGVGLVGGLLVEEALSDIGDDAYDEGYDDAMDDC